MDLSPGPTLPKRVGTRVLWFLDSISKGQQLGPPAFLPSERWEHLTVQHGTGPRQESEALSTADGTGHPQWRWVSPQPGRTHREQVSALGTHPHSHAAETMASLSGHPPPGLLQEQLQPLPVSPLAVWLPLNKAEGLRHGHQAAQGGPLPKIRGQRTYSSLPSEDSWHLPSFCW